MEYEDTGRILTIIDTKTKMVTEVSTEAFSWLSWLIASGIILSGVIEYLRREKRHKEQLLLSERSHQPPPQQTGTPLLNVVALGAVTSILAIALWWFLQNDLYIPGWIDVSSATIAVALTPLLVVLLLMFLRDLTAFRKKRGRAS